MAKSQRIQVVNLQLDLNNPRFPEPVDNQRDAINKMLEIQKEKIIALAKDIAKNGLDPSENMLVIENVDEPDLYVVCEGNRRLTALKVINDPDISYNKELSKTFTKIQNDVCHDISEVSCVVFDDDSHEHWVNLKHTGQNRGIGRVEWEAPEKARHMARIGKESYQNQLYSFIDLYPEEYKDILKSKNRIKITNLGRLFNDPDVRNAFGLHPINGFLYCNQSLEKFISDFKKILDLMIEVKENRHDSAFTVDRIYKKGNRLQLIHELNIVPNFTESSTQWKILDPQIKPKNQNNNTLNKNNNDSNTNQSATDQGKNTDSENNDKSGKLKDKNGKITRPPKADRNVLIPASLRLNFGKNKKCHRIYDELRSALNLNSSINSVAVMLRVFLDLSVTAFIEKHGIPDRDPKRAPGLHDKVVMCAEFLRDNKKLSPLQCTAITTFSKQITKANGSLQQYVHNPHFNPEKVALNTEWDNFQPLFEAIWIPE